MECFFSLSRLSPALPWLWLLRSDDDASERAYLLATFESWENIPKDWRSNFQRTVHNAILFLILHNVTQKYSGSFFAWLLSNERALNAGGWTSNERTKSEKKNYIQIASFCSCSVACNVNPLNYTTNTHTISCCRACSRHSPVCVCVAFVCIKNSVEMRK